MLDSPQYVAKDELSNSFPYMENTMYGGHKIKLTSFTNIYNVYLFHRDKKKFCTVIASTKQLIAE